MRMMRVVCLTVSAVLCASSVVQAQGRRLVHGIVRDSTTGEPLSGALVDWRSAGFRAAARSNQRGEFRLSDVPGGDYQVIVRRLGYAELLRDVRTMDRDTSLVFALTGVRRELDTIRVIARVNGISGVVGTAHALKPIPNATVQVIGLGRRAQTDSAGRYFVEIKKGGSYLVRFARAGYAHQLVTLEVPMDRSVEMSPLLDSTDARQRVGTQSLWDDFDKRIIWRGPRSALVSAGELEEQDEMLLSSALNRSKTGFRRGMVVGPTTCVFVNGLPRPGFPVDALPMARVEAVELYGRGADGTGTLGLSWPARVPCGGSQQGGPYGGAGGVTATAVYAVIWLKP